MSVIHEPEEGDVLCGRGENSFRHFGNYQFRQLIVQHANSYKMAATKKDKTQVVMLVADTIIARGGRFLVRSDDGKKWVDGGRKQGKVKAGHAFRDALRGRVKSLALSMRKGTPPSDTEIASSATLGEAIGNDFPRKGTAHINNLLPTNSAFEPSKDWKTARLDAQMATNVLTSSMGTTNLSPINSIFEQSEAWKTPRVDNTTETAKGATILDSQSDLSPSNFEPSKDWKTAQLDEDTANDVIGLLESKRSSRRKQGP